MNDLRTLLKTESNPAKHHDYLIDLKQGAVHVRYVPDKLILTKDSFDSYIQSQAQTAMVETTTTNILEDLNNELVPRWLQVQVNHDGHIITIEDRQPQWENAYLLGRLAPL